MKWNCAIVKGMIFSLLTTQLWAQFEKVSFLPSYHLNITCNKTTNLVFPDAIENVDRGSKDVLVQKVKGAENILQVKAGKADFPETNLSVITADGKLYSFIVGYLTAPAQLNIIFQKDTLQSLNKDSQPENNRIAFFNNYNADEINGAAQKVINAKRIIYGVKDKKEMMRVVLSGLYVGNDIYYFQIKIDNKSNVTYETDAIKIFIDDKQKAKRTATQEVEIQPLCFFGYWQIIRGRSSQSFVVALPKFTLINKKFLCVKFFEKNGSRELRLNVNNHHLLQTQQLTSLYN